MIAKASRHTEANLNSDELSKDVSALVAKNMSTDSSIFHIFHCFSRLICHLPFKSCKSETLMALEQFMIVGPSHARKDENDGKSSKERGAGARSGTGGAPTQTY